MENKVHWTYLQPPLGWSGHGHLPSHIPEDVKLNDDFTEDLLQFIHNTSLDGKQKVIDISWYEQFYCVVIDYTKNNDADQWGWTKEPLEKLETRDPVKVWEWLQKALVKYS